MFRPGIPEEEFDPSELLMDIELKAIQMAQTLMVYHDCGPSLSKAWSDGLAGFGSKSRTYLYWVALPSHPSLVAPTRSAAVAGRFCWCIISRTAWLADRVSVIMTHLRLLSFVRESLVHTR